MKRTIPILGILLLALASVVSADDGIPSPIFPPNPWCENDPGPAGSCPNG